MTPETIEILINGEHRIIGADLSVAGLLDALQLPRDRVALEINKRIVRKRDWLTVTVPAGAQIEIVEFVGGG